MEISEHKIDEIKFAEIVSKEILIKDLETGLQLMVDIYFQNFDGLIIHSKNICPDFFDLKTRLAGVVLQKFSNYKMKLVILGDFDKVESKSLNDFIFESNKGGLVNFSETLEKALESLK